MDVLIIGAGGHGKVVLDVVQAQALHRCVGFIDANPALAGQHVGDVQVLGQANLLPRLKSQKLGAAIVAIGDWRTRLRYARLLADQGFALVNAIHPSAVVAKSARLGQNIVVAAGAIIGPEADIADSCIVNHAAVVDHECQIGAGVHVCPAAALAGRVQVGEGAFLGLGCRII